MVLKKIPSFFHLQWHITQRCNLRCAHCYQESYEQKELTYKELLQVLDQYKNTLNQFNTQSNTRIKGHITITGGEPFVREDFMELLKEFTKYHNTFSFSILTNGTLITTEIAKELAKLNPSYIQVSIEGTEKTHDQIRGVGMYKKAVEGLRQLIKQGIRTMISFTAHKKNYKEFKHVAQLGRTLGVHRVWSDRLIPAGVGLGISNLMLSQQETKEFFTSMNQEKEQRSIDYYPKTEIAMHRALQFLYGGKPYTCSAGNTLMTINANGDLYPCRRMPIKVGNILNDNLHNVYQKNVVLQSLRDDTHECNACEKYAKCKGGLRCLAYATNGSFLKKDPGCLL